MAQCGCTWPHSCLFVAPFVPLCSLLSFSVLLCCTRSSCCVRDHHLCKLRRDYKTLLSAAPTHTSCSYVAHAANKIDACDWSLASRSSACNRIIVRVLAHNIHTRLCVYKHIRPQVRRADGEDEGRLPEGPRHIRLILTRPQLRAGFNTQLYHKTARPRHGRVPCRVRFCPSFHPPVQACNLGRGVCSSWPSWPLAESSALLSSRVKSCWAHGLVALMQQKYPLCSRLLGTHQVHGPRERVGSDTSNRRARCFFLSHQREVFWPRQRELLWPRQRAGLHVSFTKGLDSLCFFVCVFLSFGTRARCV